MTDFLRTIGSRVGDVFVSIGSGAITHTRENIQSLVDGISLGGPVGVEIFLPAFLILLGEGTALLVTLKVLHMIWTLLHEVQFMWKKPVVYSAQRDGPKRILVLGDSTAYGTGADAPEDTIAGRLGRDFPHTSILNVAVNGSLVRDAITQLERTDSQTFDLIVISTGGNDILFRTSVTSLERDLRRLLDQAIAKSNRRVVVLFYANLGQAPFFPAFIRSVIGRRTDIVHDVFARATDAVGLPLVELFITEKIHKYTSNPFFENPDRYYAKDKMHPSSEGYRLWYNYLWSELVARGFKFDERDATPPHTLP
ncbi:MAG: SGNH/GDSL hydrolase family protein [Patescibacteria group bacterium]